MAEVFCLACGDLVEISTDRRNLHGVKDNAKRVFSSWKWLCASTLDLSNDEIETFLADTRIPGIVCRYNTFCFFFIIELINQKMLWCL